MNSLDQKVLPALRGMMGDRVYYMCLLNIRELSERVHFAKEVHNNELLSGMIQRELSGGRAEEIAQYLKSQSERFFNALVLATYRGQPNWHALKNVRSYANNSELEEVDDKTSASVGFLTLQGNEKLFALDGQHRLAGIKKAMEEHIDQETYDEVAVIIVGHKNKTKELERTRRLFTTLNKNAKPVKKGQIIALDEDDVMAICARWLIEQSDLFAGDRIHFVANTNLPTTNTTSLTTIGNLYDILTILFTTVQSKLKKRKKSLQLNRPNDKALNEYFEFAKTYFLQLKENFKELDEFFCANNTEQVVKKYRNKHGGHILFRPIGLFVMTQVIAHLTNHMNLNQAVKQAATLPRYLDQEPFLRLMWEPNKKIMQTNHKVLTREILCYMAGKISKNYTEATLQERYKHATGDNTVVLPEKIR